MAVLEVWFKAFLLLLSCLHSPATAQDLQALFGSPIPPSAPISFLKESLSSNTDAAHTVLTTQAHDVAIVTPTPQAICPPDVQCAHRLSRESIQWEGVTTVTQFLTEFITVTRLVTSTRTVTSTTTIPGHDCTVYNDIAVKRPSTLTETQKSTLYFTIDQTVWVDHVVYHTVFEICTNPSTSAQPTGQPVAQPSGQQSSTPPSLPPSSSASPAPPASTASPGIDSTTLVFESYEFNGVDSKDQAAPYTAVRASSTTVQYPVAKSPAPAPNPMSKVRNRACDRVGRGTITIAFGNGYDTNSGNTVGSEINFGPLVFDSSRWQLKQYPNILQEGTHPGLYFSGISSKPSFRNTTDTILQDFVIEFPDRYSASVGPDDIIIEYASSSVIVEAKSAISDRKFIEVSLEDLNLSARSSIWEIDVYTRTTRTRVPFVLRQVSFCGPIGG